jgi:hypothetical protein
MPTDYIEDDSGAELVTEDLAEDIEELKADLVIAKQEVKDAVAVLQAQISVMQIRELEKGIESIGSDYHVEAEEEAECLGGGDETRPFSVSVAGSTATITPGIMQIGAISYEIAYSGTVTLAGATEYIYAYHKKDHSSSDFGHSSSLPNSAGDEWRFIIAKYAASGSTWNEVWSNSGIPTAIAPTA